MGDEATTTAGTAAPVEGAEATEDQTPVVETPAEGAPVEGEAAPIVEEKTEEQLAAEAEAKKADEAKFLAELPELLKKVPEAELRNLGLKYANRTMAAARRAERAAQSLTAENQTLKAKLAEQGAGPDIRKDVVGWMKANGFTTARELVDHLVSGGADKKPDPLDEVAKLRAEREAERKENERREGERQVEIAKQNVATALKGDTTRWARTSTPTGQSRLWGEIVEYSKAHGNVPDEAVYYLADQVERELRAEFGDPAPRTAAKGASTPANGAPGARTSAKATTITSKGSSGAPVVREYSLDPDEARAQILADLRAEGKIRAAAE